MPKAEIQYGGDEEYRRLWAIRDRYGVNWRWMLIEGAKFLEEQNLIGESAPDLECNADGFQSRRTRLKPEQDDPLVQRINVSDREIDHIEIELTLVESDGDADTESKAEAAAELDAEPDTDPDDEITGAGEADSLDTKSEHEPEDTDEAANAPREAEETVDATATPSKPDQEPAQDETATKTRQHGARRTPGPTRDRASFLGGTNDV